MYKETEQTKIIDANMKLFGNDLKRVIHDFEWESYMISKDHDGISVHDGIFKDMFMFITRMEENHPEETVHILELTFRTLALYEKYSCGMDNKGGKTDSDIVDETVDVMIADVGKFIHDLGIDGYIINFPQDVERNCEILRKGLAEVERFQERYASITNMLITEFAMWCQLFCNGKEKEIA